VITQLQVVLGESNKVIRNEDLFAIKFGVVRPENPILVGSRSLIETRPQPRDAPARRRPAGGGLRRRR
jgi:hypothetical protein